MSEARARAKADAWIERMSREGYGPAPAPAPAKPLGATVQEHFEAWISGELFRAHGAVNGLKIKASADVDGWRARKYLYPAIGPKLVADVTEEDIDKVMARIPADRRAGTRAKVHALLHRGFDLAIVPGRLRKDNPVTRYHKPRKDPPKLFAYLFPAELLAVLARVDVPIARRVLYALSVYSGLRKSSALALTWAAFDAVNQMILARRSKTGVAVYFEIPPGLAWILTRWRAYQGNPPDAAPIVPVTALGLRGGGRRQKDLPRSEAEALRADLRAAGVTREALFTEGPNVEPLRFHDMRATFVTWAKRAGKSDGWIADRTGHLTPEMIERYTRAARTLEDRKMEPFPDLTGTIPELAEVVTAGGERGGGGEPGTPPAASGGAPQDPSADPSRGARGVTTRRDHADLRAANGREAPPTSPGKSGISRPEAVLSGSSGVTPVEVQVLFFAPVGSH